MYSNGNQLQVALLLLSIINIATSLLVSKTLTESVKDDQIFVRESTNALRYFGVNQSQLVAPQSQIFSVRFDFDEIPKVGLHISRDNFVNKANDSKQSQEFDVSKPGTGSFTQSPPPNDTDSIASTESTPTTTSTTTTTTTTKHPTVTTNQETSSTTSSSLPTSPVPSEEPETTIIPGDQAPIGSVTTRKGDAVFCGEGNPNGKSNKNLISRIIGGSKTLPGEFPFQVRLNIRSRRGSGICGGVILNERYILTAAHCMTACVSQYLNTATIETTGVHATIGDHSIKSNDGEIDISVEKIIPHEKYDACNFYANDHDIALIKTTEPIEYKFTSDGYGSINRPCLPADNSVIYRDGESVIVSGWGVMRESSGSLSNILRYVQVPIVNVTKCQETYGSRVSNNHVCAGFQSGGKDSCQGDSGGPLVRIVKNRYELVGIVSFGYGCGQPSAPGVYTRVASYMDWIHANT